MHSTEARPSAVAVACWSFVLGSVLLIAGGLLAVLMSFDPPAPPMVTDKALTSYARLHRGAGILFAMAGLVLAWLAARARVRDLRARWAVMALGLAVVGLVALVALFSGTHILALLSVLPIAVGALLLSRPAVLEWYVGD